MGENAEKGIETNATNECETDVLFPKPNQRDVSAANSREFIEKIDEILSNTDKVFVKLSAKSTECVPFTCHGVTSVYDVLDATGNCIFRLGRCPVQENVQNFVVLNSAGHGVMTFTTSGFLNRVCDVAGAGLLSFTQTQSFNGGYTLRDPWKELLKIHCNWIPFCTCCLLRTSSSASMDVTDLDGTPSGSICFQRWSTLGCEERCLAVNFIPNLNPKAKYILFAASLKPLCAYFSDPGRSQRSRNLLIFYLLFLLILAIICSMAIKFM